MGTRVGGQILPISILKQERESPSNDVWVEHNAVISDWGLGQDDLWERVIRRSEQVLLTGSIECEYFPQLNAGRTCTCRKEETGQADTRCPICYGSSIIGGFEKYGYDTIFLDSTDPDIQLDGLKARTTIRPFALELEQGVLEGTAISAKYEIRNSMGFTAFKLDGKDGPRLITQNNIIVEYQIEGCETWRPITDSEPLNEVNFIVRFRVTLKRSSTNDPSPTFQIVRIRFQSSRFVTIKITKATFPEQRLLESFGVQVSATGITWWTSPYGGNPDSGVKFFLEENDLFEIIEGRYKESPPGTEDYPLSGRYKPTNVAYVEPHAKFISQRFQILRILQKDEPGESVF